jgi:putative tributyrin esterase
MSEFRFHYFSKVLNTQTNVYVVLPTCTGSGLGPEELYRKNVKFQVLWLLHGGAGDDLDWSLQSSVIRYASRNNLALIMPSVTNSSYADCLYGIKYWTFLTDELPRLMYSYFPLSDAREDNFVAGLSMGAHGAMKLAVNFPERFAAMACLSGAGFSLRQLDKMIRENEPWEIQHIFGDVKNIRQTVDDVYYQAELRKKQNISLPQMYLACGTEDFILPICRESRQLLEELGYKLKYVEEPGYAHQWEFWDLYIRKVIDEWLPLKKQPIFEKVTA